MPRSAGTACPAGAEPHLGVRAGGQAGGSLSAQVTDGGMRRDSRTRRARLGGPGVKQLPGLTAAGKSKPQLHRCSLGTRPSSAWTLLQNHPRTSRRWPTVFATKSTAGLSCTVTSENRRCSLCRASYGGGGALGCAVQQSLRGRAQLAGTTRNILKETTCDEQNPIDPTTAHT